MVRDAKVFNASIYTVLSTPLISSNYGVYSNIDIFELQNMYNNYYRFSPLILFVLVSLMWLFLPL